MPHDVTFPDELSVDHRPPVLDRLPPAVRGCLEDMYRVDLIMSRYVRDAREKDQKSRLFSEAVNLGRQTGIELEFERLNQNQAKALRDKFDDIMHRSFRLPYEVNEEPVEINGHVHVTARQADRIGAECGLMYFFMALERIPKEDGFDVKSYPIMNCLRILRNLTVHFVPLNFNEREFVAHLVDTSGSGKPPIRMASLNESYLALNTEEFSKLRETFSEEVRQKFKKLCDKYPSWIVVRAAIEELCRFYELRS